jgi:ATP-dependent RNA helicase DDX58
MISVFFYYRYDVFVVTAQMLVNALTKNDVTIVSFSMLIFDECHHCNGSHPFQQIMNHYIDTKEELSQEEECQLPQVWNKYWNCL